MKRRAVWLVFSCLLVTALVLASCGPAAEEAEEGKTVTGKVAEEEEKTTEEEVVSEEVEKGPQYGGTLKPLVYWAAASWDPVNEASAQVNVFGGTIYEKIGIGDWAKSPAGTGECNFDHYGFFDVSKYGRGQLAESWEQPDPLTIIVHLRKDVRWQNKPPVNGRELVADDVVYSYNRYLESPLSAMPIRDTGALESITAPDKYTVVFNLNSVYSEAIHELFFQACNFIHPREVVEMYGDLTDWKNACGTGPFLLVDVVEDSGYTYEKNPGYWGYDEVNPDNRLPYVDTVKSLVIPDRSTILSALRTGKLDMAWRIVLDDAEALWATNPELQSYEMLSAVGCAFHVRADEPPFDDISVRQACNMAINYQEIIDDYYKGKAEVINFPIMKSWTELYNDLMAEMPEDVKEIYSYNPEKARQLLAEAGYPDGFETELTVDAQLQEQATILCNYLAEVGIDVNMNLVEFGTLYTLRTSRDYTGMLAGRMGVRAPLVYESWYMSTHPWNHSSLVDEAYDAKVTDALATADADERNEKIVDIAIHLLRNAPDCPRFPHPYEFNFWQPWVKNFHGEMCLGTYYFGPLFARCWVDQDVKDEILGK